MKCKLTFWIFVIILIPCFVLLGWKLKGKAYYKSFAEAEIIRQRINLDALNYLRKGENEQAIRLLEIDLCTSTSSLPDYMKVQKNSVYDIDLKKIVQDTADYFNQYDVYGKKDKLISYEAAARAIKELE